MDISEQLEKEKKIKQEMNRIKKIYKDLGKGKNKFLEGLIHETAFMKVSLEDLRNTLTKDGMTELFEQGDQAFMRERPEVKIYTTFMNRYQNGMKLLIDLMPGKEQKDEKDKLMDFVRKGKELKNKK